MSPASSAQPLRRACYCRLSASLEGRLRRGQTYLAVGTPVTRRPLHKAGESAKGTSTSAALRAQREPLSSPGSQYPTIGLTPSFPCGNRPGCILAIFPSLCSVRLLWCFSLLPTYLGVLCVPAHLFQSLYLWLIPGAQVPNSVNCWIKYWAPRFYIGCSALLDSSIRRSR